MQLILKRLQMRALLTELALDHRRLLRLLLTPLSDRLAVLPVLALLFEFLGKCFQFALTLRIERAKLIDNSNRVRPLGILQQTLEVLEPLLQTRSDALLFLDALLQLKLLLTKPGKFLLELRPILVEIQQFATIVRRLGGLP